MSDPNFLTYQFSQQVPKTLLTDITGDALELHQKQEADRIRNNQQITYDQYLQTYMEDPSDENRMALSQAAIPLGITNETRSAVQETEQSRAAQAAEKRRLELEAVYQPALEAYVNDPSPENLNAYLEAARPLGIFDQAIKHVSSLTQAERAEDVRETASVLTHLRAGNTDGAQEAVDKLIESYAADGNDAQVETLNKVKQMIEDNPQAADTYLSSMMGLYGEEGETFMKNLYEHHAQGLAEREQQRREYATEVDMLKIGAELEYASEEDKARVIEEAQGLPYGVAQAVAELGSVYSLLESDPDAWDTVLDREESLRKEYDAYVEPYEVVVDNFDVMIGQFDVNDPSGMTDTALLTIFNKMLDPNSVVREAEAARTEQAQAIIDRAKAALENVKEGVSFTENTRRDIYLASEILANEAQGEIDRERDRLERTVDTLFPEGEGRESSSARVFPDTRTVDERRRYRGEVVGGISELMPDPLTARLMMRDMTTAEIQAQFPDAFKLWSAGGGADADADAGADAGGTGEASIAEGREEL